MSPLAYHCRNAGPKHPRGQAWQLQGVSFVEESALLCKCPVCGLINSTNKPWQLRLGLYFVRPVRVLHRMSSVCSRRTGRGRSGRKAAAAKPPERASGKHTLRRSRGVHIVQFGCHTKSSLAPSSRYTPISYPTVGFSVTYNGTDHRFTRQ
jgi:hypothetical protein